VTFTAWRVWITVMGRQTMFFLKYRGLVVGRKWAPTFVSGIRFRDISLY
jgi:hypothetical protein